MEENKILYPNNKRFLTWDYHLKDKFACKVFKVSLNGGFTCPNIDGTKGIGGCSFCSGHGSGDFGGNPHESILSQFDAIKEKMHEKWSVAKYIAYFQAHTNTYAPLERLKSCFEPVLSLENVVGLSIATRADALEEDVLNYLDELSKRTYLIVELGLQTIHDKTAGRINRCHGYDEFLGGYAALSRRGINTCVHIINGLPHENKRMMIETATEVARLKPHSIKIHLLHVLKDTVMCAEYVRGEFEFLTLEEYVDIVCDQLEILPPSTIIQRLTGDGAKDDLVGPLWSLKKFVVMNEIDKEMTRRNSYQGKKYVV